MTTNSPGAKFRAALQQERPLQCVGTINAYHARLAEHSGFRAVYLSGGGVAAGSLGLPDLGISNLDDVLIDVRRITQFKEGDTIIGMRMRAKIVKNKVAPPFRQTEFDMLGECGISFEADLIDLAASFGVIARSGSWYVYGETKLGQGRDKARNFLREHPEVTTELKAKVMTAYMDGGQVMPTSGGS